MASTYNLEELRRILEGAADRCTDIIGNFNAWTAQAKNMEQEIERLSRENIVLQSNLNNERQARKNPGDWVAVEARLRADLNHAVSEGAKLVAELAAANAKANGLTATNSMLRSEINVLKTSLKVFESIKELVKSEE